MATENKLWLPPLSPKDQKKLDKLQKNGKRSLLKWTGFSDKTLWDWLQLLAALAIPVVVAFVSFSFSTQQDASNQQQHKIDLQIANDQQRETTLQTYLDNMSDLLLNHNLRKSKSGDGASQVARERTLTTLRRLDAERNGIVLQFLQDAHLIGDKNAVIDLSGANLSNDDLRNANLRNIGLLGTNLSGVNLGNANLFGANLSNSILIGANLSNAILSSANLSGANLGNANLINAVLSSANLSSANLSGANLSGANLNGANLVATKITLEQLARSQLSQGVIIPTTSLPTTPENTLSEFCLLIQAHTLANAYELYSSKLESEVSVLQFTQEWDNTTLSDCTSTIISSSQNIATGIITATDFFTKQRLFYHVTLIKQITNDSRNGYWLIDSIQTYSIQP